MGVRAVIQPLRLPAQNGSAPLGGRVTGRSPLTAGSRYQGRKDTRECRKCTLWTAGVRQGVWRECEAFRLSRVVSRQVVRGENLMWALWSRAGSLLTLGRCLVDADAMGPCRRPVVDGCPEVGKVQVVRRWAREREQG